MVSKELSFEEQKTLIELEFKLKMDSLKFMRETEKIKHEWDLETQRIREAGIRKTQMRKEEGGFKY